MKRRGFTLVEMILATVLSALLLGGVLMVTAALARDASRAGAAKPPAESRAIDLLRWDLTNAATMRETDDGLSLTLVGQCALDRKSLAASGRLARVVYRVDPKTKLLTREQRLLDDDIRTEVWSELVASDVTRLEVAGTVTTQKPDAQGNLPIPARVSVSLARRGGAIAAEIRTR